MDILRSVEKGEAHPTGRKLAYLCPNDMRAPASSGICGPKLALCVWTWAVMANTDVAELESLNNLLKLQTTRCPSISLELVDARVKLKKWLGVGAQRILTPSATRVQYMEHDAILVRGAAMVQEAVEFASEAEDLVGDPERFARPYVPINLPSLDEVKLAMSTMQSARSPSVKLWGTAYSLLFWKLQATDTRRGEGEGDECERITDTKKGMIGGLRWECDRADEDKLRRGGGTMIDDG